MKPIPLSLTVLSLALLFQGGLSTSSSSNAVSSTDALLQHVKRYPKSVLSAKFHAEYTLMRVIGQGGFGIVLSAKKSDNTDVAVKIGYRSQSSTITEEMKIMVKARLYNVPNILPLLDSGVYNSLFYIVTPLVKGVGNTHDLYDHIRTHPLSVTKSLSFLKTLTTTLFSLHALNIVHNDVKDENVLISRDEKLTLIDFGNAAQKRIQTVFKGTFMYASPQAYSVYLKKRVGFDGKKNDVFALGLLYYNLLTKSRVRHRDALLPHILSFQWKTVHGNRINTNMKCLLEGMLMYEEWERFSMGQVLEVITYIQTGRKPVPDSFRACVNKYIGNGNSVRLNQNYKSNENQDSRLYSI